MQGSTSSTLLSIQILHSSNSVGSSPPGVVFSPFVVFGSYLFSSYLIFSLCSSSFCCNKNVALLFSLYCFKFSAQCLNPLYIPINSVGLSSLTSNTLASSGISTDLESNSNSKRSR